MRKDGVHQLLFGGFEIHRDHVTLDQLGHFGPYHVRAEEGPAVFVKDHLDQALVLAERDRLPVAHERKAADSNVELLILRSLLGETDRSNLRRAIGASWDEPFIHRMRFQTLDCLHTNQGSETASDG